MFIFNGNFKYFYSKTEGIKDTGYIYCPTIFDIYPLLSGNSQEENTFYRLVAICFHRGSSIEDSHYSSRYFQKS